MSAFTPYRAAGKNIAEFGRRIFQHTEHSASYASRLGHIAMAPVSFVVWSGGKVLQGATATAKRFPITTLLVGGGAAVLATKHYLDAPGDNEREAPMQEINAMGGELDNIHASQRQLLAGSQQMDAYLAQRPQMIAQGVSDVMAQQGAYAAPVAMPMITGQSQAMPQGYIPIQEAVAQAPVSRVNELAQSEYYGPVAMPQARQLQLS